MKPYPKSSLVLPLMLAMAFPVHGQRRGGQPVKQPSQETAPPAAERDLDYASFYKHIPRDEIGSTLLEIAKIDVGTELLRRHTSQVLRLARKKR